MSAALAASGVSYEGRRRRARDLTEVFPHAREVLRLYLALVTVHERAAQEAADERPSGAELPSWVAARVAPAVVAATGSDGPEWLAGTLQALVYSGGVLPAIVAWLDGQELPPAERYLARAACAPVLETLPGVLPRPPQSRALVCPDCGARPQLSIFTEGGEALMTGRRLLQCSRCPATWPIARMVCAGCGEADTRKLPIYGDHDVFPHLRVDGCTSCGRYLVTVDCTRDGRAVPEVDELAAVPMDLYARSRGLVKVTPNLMGF